MNTVMTAYAIKTTKQLCIDRIDCSSLLKGRPRAYLQQEPAGSHVEQQILCTYAGTETQADPRDFNERETRK
jgi:hypothetical protein